MTALTLAAIPHVLDEDEVPFVIGLARDTRPAMEHEGAVYRRADDRCSLELRAGDVWLRALLLSADGNCWLTACIGPLFDEWWPLLQDAETPPDRPFLSAAVARRKLTFVIRDIPLVVRVVPPRADTELALAVMALEGSMEENLSMAHVAAFAVIKAALLTLTEYRTLVHEVPDIAIVSQGHSLPLGSMLDLARELADAITVCQWDPAR